MSGIIEKAKNAVITETTIAKALRNASLIFANSGKSKEQARGIIQTNHDAYGIII